MDDLRFYEDLANAIVVRALYDYKKTPEALRKRPDDPVLQGAMGSLKLFFHSPWYRILTSADPDYLLARLDNGDQTRRKVHNTKAEKDKKE